MGTVYVPILRAKHGELEALSHLSPFARAYSQPLLDISWQEDESNLELEHRLADIATKVVHGWGTARAIYFDFARFPPAAATAAGSPMECLFRITRQLRVMAVPVTGPPEDRGPGTDYLQPVRNIVAKDRRGAAVRVTYATFSSPQSLISSLNIVQQHVEIDDDETDVILDAESLESLPDEERTLDALSETFSEALLALAPRKFRSIIACASSFPEKIRRTVGGDPVRLVRLEVPVWRTLVFQKRSPTVLFGDYGVVFPRETDPDGPVRAPSKIRLSTATHHVLFKGLPSGYLELCRDATRYHDMNHVPDCWGTDSIRACVIGGSAGLGNATSWVARDTNAHIEVTVRATRNILTDAGRSVAEDTLAERPWLQTLLFKE